MIPLLDRDAVRALDRDAVERLGLPSVVLMENAGKGATEVLLRRMGSSCDRPLVIGGPGQNGGDGWVVARQLLVAGHRPRAVLVDAGATVSGDAAVNLSALQALGVPVERGIDALHAALESCSLVVDALFGTGLDRPVGGEHAAAIDAIVRSGKPVFSLDVPSGVDATHGAVLGVAVRATVTATFGALKRGLFQHPAAALAGDVVLVPIGVPVPEHAEAWLLEPEDLARWVGPRPADAHKGSCGHVVVLGGPPGKSGAAVLAALGAMRAGAGLATVAVPSSSVPLVAAHTPELMCRALGDDEPRDPAEAASRILATCSDASTVVLGPGFGTSATRAALSNELALRLPMPTVLDADALTALAAMGIERLRAAAGPRVLTPHPGEAARLLGTMSAVVQADRYASARAIAERSGQVCVLKGAGTLVTVPEPTGVRWLVCARGTPALATAGSGDVLAGVIAALLCALPAPEAASAGVLLHALAGEKAARSDRGLLASDIAHALPDVWSAARHGSLR
ncbi:MAG: NAD(P)H-hydrate dehydratase [Myxococcota bacterium]|nr:NAD(P)H-hydrate dehydratase [Myxococcota bacterium]MDW8363982.1 NAD(P)H-hydrate dehydratase [Myxococcales bacterium]